MAEISDLVRHLGLDRVIDLSDPARGVPVATSRSSWVRRFETPLGVYFIKTYDYPTLWDRLRPALRWTGPTRHSRAAREACALAWLGQHQFPVPPVLGVHEERHFGLLTRAILVTAEWPGRPLDRWLPSLPAAEQREVATALGCFVRRLHLLGFRDRNLDLRNLLGARDNGQIHLCKIDSPRFRLRAPGCRPDRLARADWSRLLPQLEPLGLARWTREAARVPAP